MKNNEIIKVENDSALILYKKPRKRFGKLLFALIILSIAVAVCLNFNTLLSFIRSLNGVNDESNHTSDTNSDTSTESSTNSSIPNDTPSTNSSLSDIAPSGSYKILEKTFSFSEINNQTSYEIGAIEYSPKKAQEIYAKYGNEAPVVLIIHSACKECYSNGEYYSTSDDFYSSNENVKEIGRFIANELTGLGINTIHIDSIFKNGTLYSSKEEYENALTNALKEYPSIEYVLDISRDILINDDLSMVKPICNINENKMAQAKILVGSSEDSDLWKKNLSLATMLGSKNPELVYEVILSNFSYSYQLCPSFLKIDIGAFSNTYSEALSLSKELCIGITELIR